MQCLRSRPHLGRLDQVAGSTLKCLLPSKYLPTCQFACVLDYLLAFLTGEFPSGFLKISASLAPPQTEFKQSGSLSAITSSRIRGYTMLFYLQSLYSYWLVEENRVRKIDSGRSARPSPCERALARRFRLCTRAREVIPVCQCTWAERTLSSPLLGREFGGEPCLTTHGA